MKTKKAIEAEILEVNQKLELGINDLPLDVINNFKGQILALEWVIASGKRGRKLGYRKPKMSEGVEKVEENEETQAV